MITLAKNTFRFNAIGTAWSLEFDSDHSETDEMKLLDEIHSVIDEFDKNYSRFRQDSLVTKISKKPGVYALPEDAWSMIDLYGQLYDISGGKVTPLIGQLMEESGYDMTYSLLPKPLHKAPSWQDSIVIEHPNIIVKKPILFDFGAAGKGLLVDKISNVIKRAGISTFLINAGGDIYYHDDNKQTCEIGLEHPDNPDLIVGVASISNESICGASGNRRAWGQFTHIIDPLTLKSPTHMKACWVVAKEAMLADMLTTALYFVPTETLRRYFDFEYAILKKDMSLEYSFGFPATFYEEGEK